MFSFYPCLYIIIYGIINSFVLSISEFTCHSPPTEGIFQYLLLAFGSVNLFFPIADAHLDISPRLKVALFRCFSILSSEVLMLSNYHKKVCRGTRCRSCGIQHQVAHAFVEVFAFICDILYGSSVDAYQYGIGKRDALSFDDFLL